jgi:hypothetical protein
MQSITVTSPRHSELTDSISGQAHDGGGRTYTISLRASVGLPSISVEVETSPIAQWALPDQLPGGADNLPPLPMWNWTVVDAGLPPATAWSANDVTQQLSGVTSWTNQTIEVYGTSAPNVTVEVSPAVTDGTTTPGTGFVLNTPGITGAIPANQTGLIAAATALHPQVVRFSPVLAGTGLSWNTVTNQPQYSFTIFDRIVNFTRTVGAHVLLSLPAGTWGDGNLLPTGMPLNLTDEIYSPTGDGYFPQALAWQEYVEGIVNHTVAAGETVTYWSIGNEIIDANQSLVAAYTNVFNIAARVIHAQLPSALVGSDAMMNTTYEAYFAAHTAGVGFLSFHYYPAIGLCVSNGTYCPPSSPPNGTTDQGLFSHGSYAFLEGDFSPGGAQTLWHALTGTWVPVLNTETNLNSAGGGPVTSSSGTDPRIQTLFGASWVSVVLIDGAFQNVSDLTYFSLSSGWGPTVSLTSPYGGWGFGLTSEAANDSTIVYAPYLALEMWGTAMTAGQPGLVANSSAPSIIEPYAAREGTNVSVFLVNRVNVTVSVDPVLASGGYVLSCLSILDQRSYREVYEPSVGRTVLEFAGINTTEPDRNISFPIDGYGVAALQYVPSAFASQGCAWLSHPASSGFFDLGTTVLIVSVVIAVGVGLATTWVVFPPKFGGRRPRHRAESTRE